MIELREVTKEYSKGVAALNGINLKIEQGEFVFIVGDSGSGTSCTGKGYRTYWRMYGCNDDRK